VSASVGGMRVIAAHVRGGAAVPDETTNLPEGASVTILADPEERTFEVSPQDEAALVAALEEADRDEVVDASTLLQRLRR
jgi:hypothetical protein